MQVVSEMLYLNKLSSVFHDETGIRTLRELSRSYLTITRDLTRVMNRLKAIYRGWGIACAGRQVYASRYRAEWLAKITEVGVHRRAEIYYQQFDVLSRLRQEARRELLAEGRKHFATRVLQQIPSIGPIRAALHLFRLQVGRLWHRALSGRSQNGHVPWSRMNRLIAHWLHPVRIYHPYPLRRMGVVT
jgi:hypothetical protein